MAVNFDRVAEEYDASRYLPADMARSIAAFLCEAAELSSKSRLFDAGVGTGRFAIPLAQYGISVIGADISARMLHQLRIKISPVSPNTLPLRVVRGDLCALGLRTAQFDAALMAHILHLISNWQEAIKETLRILKPGAKLLVLWQGEANSKVLAKYFELLKPNFQLPGYRGANPATVQAWLEVQGIRWTPLSCEHLQWERESPVANTIEFLEKRVWSRLWQVPDSIHYEVMRSVRTWTEETFGSLEATESLRSVLQVQMVHKE